MSERRPTWGLLAEYDSASGIYEACEKVRDAGYQNWDACTPFPVHGLDKAMGLKPSILPWMVLVAGTAGGVLMMLFIIWAAAVDYPLNIGGKPLLSIPAFIPPVFEITILFSALTTVFGMFFLNRLPRHNHPLFQSIRFERVTDDKFFIAIESSDAKFSLEQTKAFLQGTGATYVEELGIDG